MSARELQDWQTFYAAEPFGAIRDNLHAGLIASIMVNLLREKGSAAVTPADFLFVTAEQRRNASLSDGLAAFKRLAKQARRADS